MALADGFPTIDGIPLHPLIVHAVVVLLPLSALGTVLIAVRPAWRRRFGVAVAALTVVAVAAVPVAQQTGEQLEEMLKAQQNPLVQQHSELGESLLPYAITFGALVLALVLAGWLADRRTRSAHAASAPRRGFWQVLVVPLAILAVLSAAVTTVRVVQVGHSGSAAVWLSVGDRSVGDRSVGDVSGDVRVGDRPAGSGQISYSAPARTSSTGPSKTDFASPSI